MPDPSALDDKDLLREFKAQQAVLAEADDAFNRLGPFDPDKAMAYNRAQLEAARLQPLGLEMRARYHARTELMAAGVDAELRDLLDGDGDG